MPSNIIYRSQKIEELTEQLAQLLCKSPPPPFEKEIILIQTASMEYYLNLELTEKNGISAGIDFWYIAKFFKNLLKQDLHTPFPFDKERLAWLIWKSLLKNKNLFHILPEALQKILCSKIAHNEYKINEHSLFVFSQTLSNLYERYLLYIYPIHSWQLEIWNSLLLEYDELNLNKKLENFWEGLLNQTIRPPGKRIFIFGLDIESLEPLVNEVLSKMSSYVELYYFILSPINAIHTNITQISSHSHPSSLLECLQTSLKPDLSIPRDVKHLEIKLLEKIVKKELHKEGDVDKKLPPTLPSVLIQNCHSKLREVEVLHDTLIQLFETHKDLGQEEILILCSEPESYVHLFSKILKPSISYKIVYQVSQTKQDYIDTFFKILDFSRHRFQVDLFYELLSCKNICDKFSFSIELEKIQKLLEEARITWGLDANDRVLEKEKGNNFYEDMPQLSFNLHQNTKNHLKEKQIKDYFSTYSFQDGLDRLLLSSCLPYFGNIEQIEEEKFEQVLSLDFITNIDLRGEELEILGKLINFVNLLDEFRTELREKKTMSEWAKLFYKIEEVFLVESEENQEMIREICEDISTLESNYQITEEYDLKIILTYIKERYSQTHKNNYFPGDGVHISNFTHSQNTPYKIIYLLGLDEGSLPRSEISLEFDLIEKDTIENDNENKIEKKINLNSNLNTKLKLETPTPYLSRAFQDRRLFSYLILSARQHIIFSYVGQSMHKSNQAFQPSLLLRELCQFFDSFPLTKETIPLSHSFIIKHFIHGSHSAYFEKNSQHHSYNSHHFQATQLQYASLKKPPLFWNPDKTDISLKIDESLYPSKQINIQKFTSFFKNPPKAWITNTLGLNLLDIQTTKETLYGDDLHEFSNKDSLSYYQKARDLIYLRLKFNGLYSKKELCTLLGTFHYTASNPFTHLEMDTLWLDTTKFINKILERDDEHTNPKHIQIELEPIYFSNQYRITGSFKSWEFQKQINGRKKKFQYRYTKHSISSQIQTWIEHLALLVQGIENESYLFTREKNFLFKCLNPKNAKEILEELVKIYLEGNKRPQLFFEKTSYEYIDQLQNKKKDTFPFKHWISNDFTPNILGEAENPYNKLILRNQNFPEDYLSYKKENLLSKNTDSSLGKEQNKSEALGRNRNQASNLYEEFKEVSRRIIEPMLEYCEII